MIGISKYRVQGLRDPLMVNVMRSLDIERVPLYDNYPEATRDRQQRIRDLGPMRDGPVNAEQVTVDDPAAMAERIKGIARDLGADLVGIARLQPIMLNIGANVPHEWVICAGIHEQYGHVLDGPRAVETEVFDVYCRCAELATALAARIRDMGWPALAHHNGGCDVMAIPAMYHAGLGELGKHGSLIHPQFGANFRPGFVTTTMPLVEDGPLRFGVQDYCENCQLCTNNCPGDAMSRTPTVTDGIKRWIVSTEKCYPYSRFRDEYCHICVDVCPYIHKENGNNAYRAIYKDYMKARKQAGWRSAKSALKSVKRQERDLPEG